MAIPLPGQDVIDALAGLPVDSPVAALRRQKPDLVRFAQGSYDALLEPADPSGLSLVERHAVAYRAALATSFPEVAEWHRERLEGLGAPPDLIAAVAGSATVPASAAGSTVDVGVLGPRLGPILTHTDRVTRSPGSAQPEHIAELKAAGLTPGEIVTLGQLLGFVSYQVRAIAVARALAQESAR